MRSVRENLATYTTLDGSQSMDGAVDYDASQTATSFEHFEVPNRRPSDPAPSSPVRPILKSPGGASPARKRNGGSVRFTEPPKLARISSPASSQEASQDVCVRCIVCSTTHSYSRLNQWNSLLHLRYVFDSAFVM